MSAKTPTFTPSELATLENMADQYIAESQKGLEIAQRCVIEYGAEPSRRDLWQTIVSENERQIREAEALRDRFAAFRGEWDRLT